MQCSYIQNICRQLATYLQSLIQSSVFKRSTNPNLTAKVSPPLCDAEFAICDTYYDLPDYVLALKYYIVVA